MFTARYAWVFKYSGLRLVCKGVNIYFRTNSDLCHLQHKLIGFYNPNEKCLQRGTDWVFKYSGLRLVCKGLTRRTFTTCCWWWSRSLACDSRLFTAATNYRRRCRLCRERRYRQMTQRSLKNERSCTCWLIHLFRGQDTRLYTVTSSWLCFSVGWLGKAYRFCYLD